MPRELSLVLKDILAHAYFRVSSVILLDIVTNKLPELKTTILKIKKETN